MWVRDHPLASGFTIAAAAIIFALLLFFTLPQVGMSSDNLREFYRAVLDFNGVLFGFIALIAIFGLENLRRKDFDFSDMLNTLAAIVVMLVSSTFLSFRGLLSLPAYEPLILLLAFCFSAVSAIFTVLFLPAFSVFRRVQEKPPGTKPVKQGQDESTISAQKSANANLPDERSSMIRGTFVIGVIAAILAPRLDPELGQTFRSIPQLSVLLAYWGLYAVLMAIGAQDEPFGTKAASLARKFGNMCFFFGMVATVLWFILVLIGPPWRITKSSEIGILLFVVWAVHSGRVLVGRLIRRKVPSYVELKDAGLNGLALLLLLVPLFIL